MGLALSAFNDDASDCGDIGETSRHPRSSSMSSLANPETDADVAASIVSKAVLDTGEKFVLITTAFMISATVLDSFSDKACAQLVYGIALDGYLSSASSRTFGRERKLEGLYQIVAHFGKTPHLALQFLDSSSLTKSAPMTKTPHLSRSRAKLNAASFASFTMTMELSETATL